MNRQSQNELLVSERPVRSDYGSERSYAFRRIATLGVLALVLGGVVYAVTGKSSPSTPADIPTVKAEGAYKQKPADPGGIDIPHQDVRVYDQLESKGGSAAQVEHLMPPPEVPKEVPRATTATAAPTTDATPPTPAPVATVDSSASNSGILPGEAPPKPVQTTVAKVSAAPSSAQGVALPSAQSVSVPAAVHDVPDAPMPSSPPTSGVPASMTAPMPASPPTPVAAAVKAAPAPVKAAPKKALSIEDVIASTGPKSLVPPASSLAPVAAPASAQVLTLGAPPTSLSATGKASIQLASLPSEAQASALMESLQQKYGSKLGGAKLHLARVDLGSRGVFYRIQSQGLTEGEASHICAALKQQNTGCILVRK